MSTESLQKAMRKYMSEEVEPSLYTPTYQCGEQIKDVDKVENQSDTINGYIYKCLTV